ncbi:MAG: queuosine precursor transporter [Firmicutes bacterium]|nr:queuosine precursor transporter [Bacillota bacterium]MCM1401224.1 queuosine precursor transporter [Bacteroides sp.]MCM1477227.1 queuosine precursor transporter [Bacteroides sp.]
MKQQSDLQSAPSAQFSPTFLLLAVLFCVCLIVANLMEIKTVDLGPLTITAGVIVFPISYILNDCIVEIYGFSRARFVIWLGFAMNLLVTVLFQIGLWLPGDASWHGQQAMELVFGAVPRILMASFTAFICGSMVNAYVMSRMKLSSGGNKGFSFRAIVSTVLGEGTDSAIFFPLAFAGVLPFSTVVTLILTQTLLKTCYEILILPVTIRIVRRLRQVEGEMEDNNSSYKWWKINEI